MLKAYHERPIILLYPGNNERLSVVDHFQSNKGKRKSISQLHSAPTKFLLQINDLCSPSSNPIHIFANDSTLHSRYSSSKPISAAETAQEKMLKFPNGVTRLS